MKKQAVFTLFLWIVCLCTTQSQLITTNPVFVTESGTIEIIFDAAQGTGGLNGYTGDVYAHTGVITNLSTSSSDWKHVKAGWSENIPACKMTSLGNNKWKLLITPDIRTYYNMTDASETVQQLAFVFRSADGTKEGKATGGKDIFVEVHPPGLTVSFAEPAELYTIIEKGQTLAFTVKTSSATTIKCLVGATEIASLTNATELKTSYTFSNEGNYSVIAEAGTAPNIFRDTVYVISRPAVVNETRPQGTLMGININTSQSATLCLYAPGKQFVYLTGDFNDWKIDNNYLMKKDGDYWWLTVTGLESGKEVGFQYFVDGKFRIADPYADKILDPWNDKYIPATVYPNLKPYPEGKTEGIVSVFQPGQTSYNWQVANFQSQDKSKLVIYELLLRDFTEEHSYQAAMEHLDYLKTMGVNAVELMPVNEFEGNDSWGYNPSFYFAPDKYYGTKNDFKTFIDACHQRGMAVIMDMVLNHSYGQSPFVQLYWDGVNQRPAANNPWYNVTSPNPTYSWGYDFNHESPQTKALVDSICSYWMSQYKIDGFRFDFTKGFTQKPGDGWVYDASRIAILKRMASEIYKRKPKAIVIFEHLTENNEEIELADADIILWGNMNNNYCEGIMGYTESNKSDLSWSIYKERNFHQPNLLAYMESHDEERMVYKAKQWGNTISGYDPKNLDIALKRAALSVSFYLTTPGPKMIWQFGELGYDFSINTCTDGTVSENCRLSKKPVHWDYFTNPGRRSLYDIYTDLNYLKQKYPVFSTTDFSYSMKDALKSFVWKGSDMNAFSIGNFDVKEGPITVALPHSGKWYEIFTGSEVNLPSTTFTSSLQAGEYRIYTDKKVELPTEINPVSTNNSIITVYPNPVGNVLFLKMPDKDWQYISTLKIIDLSGRVVINTNISESIDVSGLTKGVYFLKCNNEVHKFIKK